MIVSTITFIVQTIIGFAIWSLLFFALYKF